MTLFLVLSLVAHAHNHLHEYQMCQMCRVVARRMCQPHRSTGQLGGWSPRVGKGKTQKGLGGQGNAFCWDMLSIDLARTHSPCSHAPSSHPYSGRTTSIHIHIHIYIYSFTFIFILAFALTPRHFPILNAIYFTVSTFPIGPELS